MTRSIRSKYEKDNLKSPEPVDLEEGEEVIIKMKRINNIKINKNINQKYDAINYMILGVILIGSGIGFSKYPFLGKRPTLLLPFIISYIIVLIILYYMDRKLRGSIFQELKYLYIGYFIIFISFQIGLVLPTWLNINQGIELVQEISDLAKIVGSIFFGFGFNKLNTILYP